MNAAFELSGPSHPPAAGGPPRQLVVLFHGVGADGNDLIGLAPYWARALPHAEFLAPNAPFPCDMAPFGYQWFSLLDRNPARLLAGVRATAPLVNDYLDTQLAARGLGAEDLALVGFSQGTMAALHVALRRPEPVAAVLGYSGALLGGEVVAEEIVSRPPVLLIHGDADEVVPVQVLQPSVRALEALGVPVQAMVRPGLGHSIDMEGLTLGGSFLAQNFRTAR